ncbi:MAG: hypothetical protein WCT41_01905 [Candidatus Paceibacterota bacterium]|jgi:hypothetical protein
MSRNFWNMDFCAASSRAFVSATEQRIASIAILRDGLPDTAFGFAEIFLAIAAISLQRSTPGEPAAKSGFGPPLA